ncbi:MAG: AbrB/MazE/SpoVT family DNA-binding domain-containing protein [Thermoproteales archaeon]|nr:AbrB/MazE/SpoVT family DNA-binding domain-containing protein [Thermoproteales archaeon]
MELSKVSRKFLTNVPAKVRKALGIEEGDLLAWSVNVEKKIIVVKVIKNPYKALCGKYHDPTMVYDAVEEKVDDVLFEAIRNAGNRG